MSRRAHFGFFFSLFDTGGDGGGWEGFAQRTGPPAVSMLVHDMVVVVVHPSIGRGARNNTPTRRLVDLDPPPASALSVVA